MRRLLSILLVLLLLTGCAPQSAVPTAVPSAEPAPTLAPAPTPESTAEDALHELLDDYAPQSLNMFRPFEPIAISPEQFMEEMAVIRALPFEQRTDWFVEHGLCIPEPSEDTDVDWQMETNLWSTYADYRCCTPSEMITGCKDGIETQWQFVYSDPLNNGGAQRCGYAVLFERTEGEPWKLIDILYYPQVWEGSHEHRTLFAMTTANTFSLYDPAQRGIFLTVLKGEVDVEYEGLVTRYVYDLWDWQAGNPLSELLKRDAVTLSMLYERYPDSEMEFSEREELGGYAVVYKMEGYRPVQVKAVRQSDVDPSAFLKASADDLLREDYVCSTYSKDRGDMVTETGFFLTESRRLTIQRVHERNVPLYSWWRDGNIPCARLCICDGSTVLQTIEVDELASAIAQEGTDEWTAAHRLDEMFYEDLNGDGYLDLEIIYGYEDNYSYVFYWDETLERFVFQGAGKSSLFLP